MTKLSILLPSIGRPIQLQKVLKNILDVTPNPDYEVIVVAGDDDTSAVCSSFQSPVKYIKGGDDAVQGYNLAAAIARGDWMLGASDDSRFLTGWLEECWATPNQGFLGLSEGEYSATMVGYFMMTRDVICDIMGGAFQPPTYHSWYGDCETSMVMKEKGLYTLTRNKVIEHLHYTLGLSADDETYARGRRWRDQDTRSFLRRRDSGFPIEWQPIIKRVYEVA